MFEVLPNLIKLNQYAAVENSNNLGFSIIACREIVAGEEIYVNYGPSYFEDEPNGCPCLTCKPANADPIQKTGMVTRQPFDVNERRSANKRKRSRQAENKRKKQP